MLSVLQVRLFSYFYTKFTVSCIYIYFPTVQTGECKYDPDCPDNEACIERYCQNPCQYPRNPCGTNADCVAILHRPVCQCQIGWVGNPHKQCHKCKSGI